MGFLQFIRFYEGGRIYLNKIDNRKVAKYCVFKIVLNNLTFENRLKVSRDLFFLILLFKAISKVRRN